MIKYSFNKYHLSSLMNRSATVAGVQGIVLLYTKREDSTTAPVASRRNSYPISGYTIEK